MLKQVSFFLFLFILPVLLFAQQPGGIVVNKDSAAGKDSFFVKQAGLAIVKSDSSTKKDTIIHLPPSYQSAFQKLLKENRFLNSSAQPVGMTNRIKKQSSQDNFFYLLAAITALFGFSRFFYTRYFDNLFRVFFNASLRQSQLTDQLLQDKLPSLFFNVLFVVSGGVYAYLLLRHYHWISASDFWPPLFYCTASLGIIYLIKFITVKFTGWVTGFRDVTNIYVFIIFLINKILGILLLPFAFIIAFSIPVLANAAVLISLLLIGLMFLLRFFRSYGLLQHQLKISRFHFFMYVVGIEIVPVLLIYKGLAFLLSKNL